MTLSIIIVDIRTQTNELEHSAEHVYCYAECRSNAHYAVCHYASVTMMSVTMQNVIVLSISILSAVILGVVMLRVLVLSFVISTVELRSLY